MILVHGRLFAYPTVRSTSVRRSLSHVSQERSHCHLRHEIRRRIRDCPISPAKELLLFHKPCTIILCRLSMTVTTKGLERPEWFLQPAGSNRWEPVLMQMADCVSIRSCYRRSGPVLHQRKPRRSASLRRRAGQSAGQTETSVLSCIQSNTCLEALYGPVCVSASESFEFIAMGAIGS